MLRRLYKNLKTNRQNRQTVPMRRTMQFEMLEPRILLSADLGIEAPKNVQHADTPPAQYSEVDASQTIDQQTDASAAPIVSIEATRTELIFADSSLQDSSSLIDGLQQQTDVTYEIHVLDGTSDGVAQISDVLAGRTDIGAIHILSHGSSGHLTLGATTLDTEVLNLFGADFTAWGGSLAADGDILLYGCDIGAGMDGLTFIQSLANLTGADVAASANATGASDWALEAASGTVETAALSAPSYQHQLLNLSGSSAAETLWLDDDGTATDGWMRYSWDFGSSWNPFFGLADDLLIDLGGGNDSVVIRGFDTSFSSRLQIVGGGGNDTILVNSGVAITADQIDWGAETITITGSSLTAAGSITFEAVAVDNRWDGSAQASITIDGATLSGSTISIAASTSVTADAGLDLGLPVDVALINTHSNAIVSFSGASQINSTGAVTITATSTTATTALAKAKSLGGPVTADAAVATSIVDGSAAVRITGTTAFSTAGALSLSASNTRSVTTTADGSAGGATAAGGSVAVTVVTGNTEAYLGESARVISAGSLSISASKLDNIATSATSTSGGAAENAGSTQTESRLSEYKAETSSGTVTIAGAVAVTDLKGHTWAYIASNQAVTTSGSLSVESLDNSDASTKADGSSVGSASVGVGAGVAINIAKIDNQAYLGGTGTITAQGVVVRAGLASESGETTSRHILSAEAVSGASGGSVGVAGALALNIVDAQSVAAVKSGADVAITGGGDVRLTAENTTVNKVIAQPSNAGAVAGSVGIGASVALNIANTRTVAVLADGAVLTGAGDLTLSATSDNSVITEAKAGGAATGGSGVGIGGAIATSVVSNDTQAVLGSGGLQTVAGDLKAVATHTGSTTTFADGSAGGSSAGIGIALGLNVVSDTTLSTSKRNINAGGDVMFAAHASAASSAGAKASAAGAEGEGDTPDEQGVDKKIAAERTQADKKATESGTQGSGATETPKAETSEGGVSVAAAVGVNLARSTAQAYIPDNGTVTSGGLVTLSASNNTDATAKADGSATSASGGVSIGAAVALNLASAVNEASVGTGSTIAAKWLTVEAKRTEVSGDSTGTIGAEAISGASGGKVGLAGSLALNIADSRNVAEIKGGSIVTLSGGDIKVIAEGSTDSKVLATAKGASVEPEARVTAAGDTALITLETKIGTGAGELNLTPAGAGTADLVFSLRSGQSFVVVLNGATTVKDVIDKINTAGNNNGKLVASFDEAKQQFVFTDTTTPADPVISASTSATQTGSPVFYQRNGGTAIAVPFQKTTTDLNFALQVGSTSERFFVTVAGKDYDTGATYDQTKAAWLADIKEAIRQAMVDAGQLKASDAAVVDVKFIGGQLIFDSAKTLTIWTDTKTASVKQFKVEAVGSAVALSQLGLGATTANAEGSVLTGAKVTAVSAEAVARKAFAAETKVSVAADTIELGAGHALQTGDAAVYNIGDGAAIGGLTDGTIYYAITDGTTKVKLASTAANAKAGTAIDLTSTGSGTQSLTVESAAPASGGGNLGIGASVALNISNTTALAQIANTAVITGTINDITLSADSISKATTTSTAGGEAAGGSGVGIGGAISIAVLNTDTTAYIGSGSALTLGGDLSATATHRGAVVTKADGAASGGSAAVGLALGLNVVTDSAIATTQREISAAKDMTFTAVNLTTTTAVAKASAKGAEGEKDDGSTPNNGVDQQVGKQRGLADKKAAEGGTKGSGTTETPKAETSDGGVSVAAAVGVNITLSETRAYIPDQGKVSAGGTLTLNAANNTDATSKADGSAVDPNNTSVGIGAAIALNYTDIQNKASIGTGANVTASVLVIEAKMAGEEKPFAATDVSATRDSINVGADNGLQTGDTIVYDNGGGASIGGLTSGDTYYVVMDDTRTFNILPSTIADFVSCLQDLGIDPGADVVNTFKTVMSTLGVDIDDSLLGAVGYKDNWIDLGDDHFLKDGDLVVYSKANLLNLGPIDGLKEGSTYTVKLIAGTNRIQLLDPDTKDVVDLKFSLENISLFDHKLTIVSPAAVKLAATAEDALEGKTIDLTAGASGTGQKLIEKTHSFNADAQSGAGASKVGVAGSLALNIVTNNTEAEIKSGATVTAGGGDVVLRAANTQNDAVKAASKVSGGNVGVGASIALNVLPVNVTRAEITDTAILTGGDDLTLVADSHHAVWTTAKAGAAGGTAVSPVVAVAYVENDTTARIGSESHASTLSLTGGLTVQAKHMATAQTTADASVASDKVGVGAAVGVSIIADSTTATVARDITAGGATEIKASATQASNVDITASAKGNKSQEDGGKDSDATAQSQADSATGGTKTLPKAQDNLATANTNASNQTNKPGGTGGGGGNQGTGSASVGVAAAIGVNWVTSDTTAAIADGVHLIAGGALDVLAESETDLATRVVGASISTDANNEDNKTNVGAAVGLNVADVSNRAMIGAGATVEADGITVKAVTPTGKTNDARVWALAIGGGKSANGVAGSAGINVLVMDTEASVGQGAHLTSLDGIAIEVDNAIAYQNIAGGGGVGKKAGVGVAVAANIIVQDTDAFIGKNAHADAKEVLSVEADSSVTPLTLNIPGLSSLAPGISSIAAGGGVSTDSEAKAAVGGSAIVDVFVQNTHASIGEGAQINATTGFTPGANQGVSIEASSTTRIVNGAGGIAVAFGGTGVGIGLDVGVIVKDTSVSIGPSATVIADKDVTLRANSTEDILSLAMSAGVSKENGIAGALAVSVLTAGTGATIEESTVDAGGDVSVTAVGTSEINTIALGVGASGKTAVGAAGAVNVITNAIEAEISDSTVSTGGDVSIEATNASIIRTLGLAVAGSGENAVAVTGQGNVVVNTVRAAITGGSTVTAAGDVMLSAEDEAPSMLPDWMISGEQQDALDEYLEDSPIDLRASILAVNVSVAGTGQKAVGVALMGNAVANTIQAEISGSTVRAGVNSIGTILNADADVFLDAYSKAGILAVSVGVGASGDLAIQGTAFGNVITNRTEAAITGGSNVRAADQLGLTAEDDSSIRSLGLSIAASGSNAISGIIGANVITNQVTARIAGSTVTSGGALGLSALSDADIMGFAGGVAASGSTAVQVTLAGNVVTNTTRAVIENEGTSRSIVNAGGAANLSAKDSSTIDALAFGVSGSGSTAVGVALAANTIVNTIETRISGSTLETGSTLSLASESSAIIRALAIGVAGSGSTAVQVSALGNAVANTVKAAISDGSIVTAAGDVTLKASDIAPSLIPDWIVPANRAAELNSNLAGSPVDLSGNILAAMVSVAASSSVAVNAAVVGNVIVNTIDAEISDSEVHSTGGAVDVDALSKAGIMALTVGVAGSGSVAVNATGYGNVITNRVGAAISADSTVTAGGLVDLTAKDQSMIRSLGISVAGSGAVAVGALIAANVITNTVVAEITGSTVTSGSTLDVVAISDSSILSLAGGVAASGTVGVLVSLTGNVITGTTSALVSDSTLEVGGAMMIGATNSSTIDALAFGVAAGTVGVGVAFSANVIVNTTEALISGSTITDAASLSVLAESTSIIRSLAVNVGAGAVGVNVNVLGNALTNHVRATVEDSAVTTAGDIVISAQDLAPSVIPDWIIPDQYQATLEPILDDSPIDLDANILSATINVGAGAVGVNVALVGNLVVNTTEARINNSTLTSTTGKVVLGSASESGITSFNVGVGGGAVAVNVVGYGNVITSIVGSTVENGSVIDAGGAVAITAENTATIRALGIGVAGGAVAVGVMAAGNLIVSTVDAKVDVSEVTSGTTLDISALSDANIIALTCAVGAGAVGVNATFSANIVTGTTTAGVVAGSVLESGGAATIEAINSSTIDALAFGVGAGAVGVGVALSANVIVNTTEALISGSTITGCSSLSILSESSAIIRSLAVNVGAGAVGVNVNVLGNVLTNHVRATVENSAVTADGDIVISAQDLAPSAIPDWIIPDQYQADLEVILDDTPIDLDANILSATINVTGGGVAANVNLVGNLVVNTTEARIDRSTLTSTTGKVELNSASKSGITSLNVGVAGGGVAVNVVGYGNNITSFVGTTVEEGSVIDAGGAVAITAENTATIRALGIGVAAGPVAVGVMAAGNLIVSTVDARVDASEVTSGTTLDITALSDANIMALTGGVSAGGVGVSVAFSGNMITGFTTAEVLSGSLLEAGGAMTILSSNSSTIDALSFGVAAGGVGVGVALSANVIANSTKALISGSTVTDAASLEVLSESSSIIRSLAINVGAGSVAVTVGVLGNLITTSTLATVEDSDVTASGDIVISAQDLAPSVIPAWIVPTQYQGILSAALHDSPIDLDANILAVNVSVAGGGVAASGALTGNLITNTAQATIDDAEVTSSAGGVALEASSSSGIIALTAGVGVGGSVAANITGFGNAIVNTVDASIGNGSNVTAGTTASLAAVDSSAITSIGLGLAGSGGAAINGTVGYNLITNSIIAEVSGSNLTSTGAASLAATSEADILSFVGGVAGSGLVAAQLSLTINEIENTIRASIVDDNAGASTVTAGSLTLSATDASTIDSVAMGLSASGFAAGGAAVSKNLIANEVSATISGSEVTASGAVSLEAESSDIIRSYAIGVAGAGLGAANASLTLNDLGNTVTARVEDSTVTAGGDISLAASETAPAVVPDFNSAIAAPAGMVSTLTAALQGNKVNANANIVSFAGSISVSGVAALGAAVADNAIHGTVTAEIVDSTATSTGGAVTVSAASDAAIASLAAGFGASAGVAANASAVNNTLTSTIQAGILGESTVSADGDVKVEASDTAAIDALAFSLAGGYAAVGGAMVVNTVENTTLAHISGTSDSQRVAITDADILTISASSNYRVSGLSLGATLGGVAAGGSVVSNSIGGSTSAYIGDHADIGGTVGNVSISAQSVVDVSSDAYGLSGGILSGSVNSANATVDTAVDAHIGDADVHATGAVNVAAGAAITAETDAFGLSVAAGLAIGVSQSEIEISSAISAYVEGDADIAAASLTVVSSADVSADAYGNASGGGLLSGNGTDVDATVTPTLLASVGEDATIALSGLLSVAAKSTGKAKAKGEGITVGVAGLGVIFSEATLSPTIETSIGAGASITAGEIRLQSLHNVNADGSMVANHGAEAYASASGGGIVNGQGAVPTATANAHVATEVAAGATLVATGNVSVLSQARNSATADATAISIGAGALGASIATAAATGDTTSAMDGTILQGTGLTVLARGVSDSDAHADASGGGLISAMLPLASSTAAPKVTARIGDGSQAAAVNATGNVSLVAQAESNANADAAGIAAGVAGVGSMNARAATTPVVEAAIGAGSTVTSTAGNISLRALHNMTTGGAIINKGATVNASSCGAGLFGGAGANAQAITNAAVTARVNNSAALLSTAGSIDILANTYNKADADATGNAYGAAAAGSVNGAATVTGSGGGTLVTTGTGVNLTAGNQILLTGQTVNVAHADGQGGAGGAIASGGVDMAALLDHYSTQVLVGAGNTLTAGTTLTAQALHSADIQAHATQNNSGGAIVLIEVEADALITGSSTKVSIGNGTTIEAEDVVLKAQDVAVAVQATTYSKTYQAAGDTDAESTADADLTTLVEIKQGVDILAPGSITLASLQQNTSTFAKADTAIGAGLTGNLRSDAWNYLDANANIVTETGTTMTTSDLLVRAQSPQINGGYVTIADTDAQTVVNFIWDVVGAACKTVWTILTFGLWDGKEVCEPVMGWVRVITNSDVQGHTYGYENRPCLIQFNSDVIILGQEAKLVVNADNSMVAEGVTATVDVTGGEVRVDDIESDGTGRVFFDSILGTLTGTASFLFNTTASVDISNYSALDLVLNDIDTFVGTADASSLTLNVSKPNMSSFHYTFETGPGENAVTIVNFGDSSIQLNGVIDAPYGVVSVIDYGIGDIQAASGNRITARELLVDSRQGSIGADGASLNIELVQIGLSGTVLTPEMTLLAGTDIFAQVRGVDRDDDPANAYRAVVRDLTGTGTVAVQFLDCEQVSSGTNQANVVLTALTAGNVINIDTSGLTGDDYSLSSGVVYDPTAATNQTFDPSLTTETFNPDADISSSTATSLTGFAQTFAADDAAVAANTISITGHGLTAGEQVIYQAGTQTIGLTSGTYYVVVLDADTIQLATNAAGTMIANITAATGAMANHRLTSAERLTVADASSLAVGDAVIYASTGTAIGGLTDGATYYIASLSGHNVTLAATSVGPDLVVDPTVATGSQSIGIADRIFCNAASSLAVGDAVVYTSGSGTSIGGLTSGTTYYVADVTGNFIQLAATHAEATAANPTVITLDSGTATGTNHQLTALRSSVQVIDTFSQAAVSGSTITLTGHSFRTGEAVVYANGGANSIGGLTEGVTYYVVVLDANHIGLAASAANAAAGTVIALTGTTGDYHTLTSLEQIDFGTNHGFATGDLYTYSNGGGTSIGGLTNGQTYYVIAVSNTAIRLASSLANAQARIGMVTTLAAASGDDHSLGSGDTIAISNHGFANGQEVIYRSNSGTAIGGLTDRATYYVIKLDANSFKLAASLADVTATTPVAIDLDPSVATGTQHTFDLSIAIEASDSNADILRFSRGHSYETGDAVVYHQGSAGAISGLVDGTTYYAVKLSGSAIQLADTAADAIASAGTVNIVLQKADLGAGTLPAITVTAPGSGGTVTTITLILNTTAGSETTVQQMVDAINGNPSAAALITASVAANGNLLATAGFWSTVELSSSRSSITLPFYDADTRTASGSGTFVLEHSGSGNGNLTITSGLNDIELAGAVDYGTGEVTIATAGNIVRTSADQLITAGDITLASSLGQVGDELTPIRVDIDGGSLNVSAEGDIAVTEFDGDMRLGSVLSGSGDVFLSSPGAILDAEGDAAADISGNALTLTAATTVGTADNAVEIASNLLTANAGDSVHLHEVAGDLNLNQVVSTNGDVVLTAQGSILDANGSNAANIEANTIALTSLAGGIGTTGNDLEINTSATGQVEAAAAGSIVLHETSGSLRTGSILSTGGSLIRLTVPDTTATGEDLIMTGAIEATAGSVVLRAGDDILLADGATIDAAQEIVLKGDAGNADSTGTIIDLQGVMTAAQITIEGDVNNDIIVLTKVAAPTVVRGLGGDDLFRVGSMATPTANSGGVVETIASSLTISGGDGFDTLEVDDSGDSDGDQGTLTDHSITGLGMAEGILYDTIERIEVTLGSGDDTFNTQSTASDTSTRINGGDGDDTFNISSDAPGQMGDLDGIRGDLHIDGGAGDNILNVSDRGNTTGRTGIVIDENGITGFGDFSNAGGRITYEASGSFSSGLNLALGSGNDEVTVLGIMPEAVLTLRMGGGEDRVELRDESEVDDGLALVFGEGGNDTVDGSAWNSDLILFGDGGIASFQGGVSPAHLTVVESVVSASDGADILIGGSGNDLLVGGGAGDRLEGGPGNDVLIGDGGRAVFANGVLRQAGTTDFFTGGDDTLIGGPGNDFMFGGYGHDTFYGNFSEDVMIGEYGRMTLHDGKIESLVVFGQPPLDLLASTLFDLYTVEEHERTLPDFTLPKWTADLAQIDDSGQENHRQTLPGLSQRLSHSGSLVQMQAKQRPDAKGTGRTHSVPGPTAPVIPGGELPDNAPGLQMENPTQPAEQQSPQPAEQGQPSVDTDIRIDTPEQLEILVAGCAGWGLAAGRTPSGGTNKQLDLNGSDRKTAFWRWDRGQLQRGNVSRLREGEKNASLPRFAVANEATGEQRPRRVEL